ncbi:MAG TPA: methyl-accepting chemotaxis protein, partial [Polyangiaceae bacterium]|nr:methyl-accepting chemotaxis protein [Polyangiaceae bacterium]
MNPRLLTPLLAILGPALVCSLLASRISGYVPQLFLFYGLYAAGIYLFWKSGEPAPVESAVPAADDGALRRAKAEVESLKDELEQVREELDEAKAKKPAGVDSSTLREPARDLGTAVEEVERAVPALADVTSEVGGHVKTVTQSLAEIYQSIETLATNAEESSSSILEMTTTNEEVAQNVGELATSVRETATSIEEMAYSIREVARNIDALSLTAEETSSSMNEMDVSIDQVQSNANETARLSEEVALDAERGAEAILKTIGEIYRIKESSQEAVAVISNLGFRIEAIGQFLAVIDDVAEQTNL